MLISVIMCIYKEKLCWIRQSINSIVMQSYKNLELIMIVDNPDISLDILSYLEQVVREDSRVSFYVNEKNVGPSESRNRGISYAKGELIALMDSDDVSHKERLQKEYEYLVKNQCDVVACLYNVIDEEGNKVSEATKIDKDIKKIMKYSNFMANSSLMIKKNYIEKIGGYRNFRTGEDYDMLLRLLSIGCSFGMINEYLIDYRVSKKSRSNTSVLTTRNDYYYIQKLFKERTKAKKLTDSHSEEYYKNYLEKMPHTEKDAERYFKAQSYIEKGIFYKHNSFAMIMYFLRALVVGRCFTIRELVMRAKIFFA